MEQARQTETYIEITPGSSSASRGKELFQYRELFFYLCWRDILIRYKQTLFGVLWAVIRPLITMIAFTLIFGRIAKLPTDNAAPYPLLVFAALIPWQLFSTAVQQASESIVSNAQLISKIYFPRVIIPVSSIASAVVDSLFSTAVLIGMMIYYRYIPDERILLLPVLSALCALSAFSIGLIISALNVFYRDFKYLVPFALQFGLYISPVGFSSSIIPEQWRFLYSLNPMVGIIDGFRWVILGEGTPLYLPGIVASSALTLVLLIIGLTLFGKMESSFADKI